MSGKILIIEDDASIARLLLHLLRTENYDVRVESTGLRANQAAIEFRPELILLDLGLPDLDGRAVLRQLRDWYLPPIIIVTARESIEDKVAALDEGADDYLTKPFSPVELLARVRAALRRTRVAGSTNLFHSGPLECDLEKRSVKMNGKPVKLTATEFEILKLLVQNAGQVVTHRQLLKNIWGPNAVEHTQYLRVYVGLLRKKLTNEASTRQLIITEPGNIYHHQKRR